MKKQKLILRSVAGLAFMVFVAVNLTVSLQYHGDKDVAQLTLIEMEAQAQSGYECLQVNDCIGDCWIRQVTPQTIYYYAIDHPDCRPRCYTGGMFCCPVWVDKWCYP